MVALFTRAWIEMFALSGLAMLSSVALFTRAWIEIAIMDVMIKILVVALFTRAWIEIEDQEAHRDRSTGRPLHEGVD